MYILPQSLFTYLLCSLVIAQTPVALSVDTDPSTTLKGLIILTRKNYELIRTIESTYSSTERTLVTAVNEKGNKEPAWTILKCRIISNANFITGDYSSDVKIDEPLHVEPSSRRKSLSLRVTSNDVKYVRTSNESMYYLPRTSDENHRPGKGTSHGSLIISLPLDTEEVRKGALSVFGPSDLFGHDGSKTWENLDAYLKLLETTSEGRRRFDDRVKILKAGTPGSKVVVINTRVDVGNPHWAPLSTTWVFDEKDGFNPTRWTMQITREGRRTIVREINWNYMKDGDSFIPNMYEIKKMDHKGELLFHRKMQLLKVKVNNAIQDDQFLMSKLPLQDGDFIRNNITNESFEIVDGSPIKVKARSLVRPSRGVGWRYGFLLLNLLFVAIVVILWQFHRRSLAKSS